MTVTWPVFVSVRFERQGDGGYAATVIDPNGGNQRDPGKDLARYIVEGTEPADFDRLMLKVADRMADHIRDRWAARSSGTGIPSSPQTEIKGR